MAKSKKGRGGDDVIVISSEDWKGKKNYPTAPGGKYRFRFDKKKSKIAPNAAGTGNNLQLFSIITALHNGKKTKHKGIDVMDNIAPHVGWKIAQVLRAMGVKKPPKKMTLQELLNLIKKFDKEIRAVIGIGVYQGKKKNNVIQYLPLKASKDEEDDDTEDDDEDDEEDSDDEDEDEDDEDEEDEDEDEEDSDDEDEDEDDEDEDEDEEDEKPRKKSKKRR